MRCLECSAPRDEIMSGKCRGCMLAMWDRVLAETCREFHSLVIQKENYLAMYRNGSKYPVESFDDSQKYQHGFLCEKAHSKPPCKMELLN